MPLNPETAALLKAGADAGLRPYETLTVEEARAQIRRASAQRGPGKPVAYVEDRTIPGPETDLPIRVYHPAGSPPFPALVFFHGSGFVIADLDTHDAICRDLTNESGCALVSVDYRLAPEHPYPAAPQDAFAATRWVAQHGTEIGVDGSRLAVGGDSAGGNLATVVALMAREASGPALAGQILIYPVTNYSFDTPSYRENAEGYGLGAETMRWFWGHYLRDEAHGAEPYASPLRSENLAGLPPAHVVTAECDPLRDEGEAYAERLKDAGVPTTVRRYDGLIHGFFNHVHQVPAARVAVSSTSTALRTMLQGDR